MRLETTIEGLKNLLEDDLRLSNTAVTLINESIEHLEDFLELLENANND